MNHTGLSNDKYSNKEKIIHSGNLVLSTKQAVSNKILVNNTLHYSQNTAPHQII